MEMTGDVLIDASREKVWAALDDPAVLMRCIPGCESIEVTSPTEKSVRVMVKVGPVRARFVGRVRMDLIRPNECCVLHFEGSGGQAGMATGHSNVELSAEGGATRLRYTVTAAVGGKLGQIGGRMIDAASKQMADQFFAAFNEQVGAAPAAAAEAAPAEPAPAQMPVPAGAAAPARPPVPGVPQPLGEYVRVLWFLLGSLSTAFGVWIASRLAA